MNNKTTFECNGIIVISAPRIGEEGPSRRLTEDIKVLTLAFNLAFEPITIRNKNELIGLFKSLEINIKNGLRPLLHFDAHGHEECGLQIGETGEYLSWIDMAEELRKLNIASNNNLFVFIAACYGFNVLKSITIKKPSPYYIVFGPSKTVTVEELELSITPFYKNLFESSSVDISMQWLPEKIDYFHCERVFARGIAGYFHEQCSGKGKKERQEKLLTEVIKGGNFENTPYVRKKLRKEIKKVVKPTPEVVKKFSKVFLHGKMCSIPYEKLLLWDEWLLE